MSGTAHTSEPAWLPWLWIVYAAVFVAYPFVYGPGPLGWWPHVAGLFVFLALYAWGLRLSGRQRLVAVAGLAILGILLTRINVGALVFFIYAASFVGGAVTGWRAAVWIAGVAAACAGTAWWMGLTEWPLLLSGTAFSVLIGFINVQDAATRRRDAALRLAQEEMARLAAYQERHRIAADLHDVLGHTLSVIVLKAELAGKLLARDPDAARTEMADVERVARDALATTRSVVTGIHAATLDDELLRARTVLATAGVDVTVTPADGRLDLSRVSPRVEHALALALREAVTNVLRHARATRCRMMVAVGASEIVVTVEDNGRGNVVHEGTGLLGMRARVTEVGGRLDIASKVMEGRTFRCGLMVRATVPLSREAAR